MADSKAAAYTMPAAEALAASIRDGVRPNAKLIALLSLGHFVVDLNQGSLPAMRPFLKSASSFSVSIVLGQAYRPRNSGTASGLIVGFAIGAGGLGVAALGRVADHYGLTPALWISALLPLAAFGVTRFLPAPRVSEAR